MLGDPFLPDHFRLTLHPPEQSEDGKGGVGRKMGAGGDGAERRRAPLGEGHM